MKFRRKQSQKTQVIFGVDSRTTSTKENVPYELRKHNIFRSSNCGTIKGETE